METTYIILIGEPALDKKVFKCNKRSVDRSAIEWDYKTHQAELEDVEVPCSAARSAVEFAKVVVEAGDSRIELFHCKKLRKPIEQLLV